MKDTRTLWDSRCISLLHSFRAACPPALPQFCLCLDGFFISVQALFCKSYLVDRPEVLPQACYQADTVRTNVTCGIYDARHLVILIVWIGFPHALPFVMSVARPLYYLWHCLTCYISGFSRGVNDIFVFLGLLVIQVVSKGW